MSTAMIRPAPTALAAMIALRPTEPAPNTARVWPAPSFNELSTAPAPVWIPHPRGARCSSGMSSGALTAWRASQTAWVAKEDWPKKAPCTVSPSFDRGLEPSARAPPKFSGTQSRQ